MAAYIFMSMWTAVPETISSAEMQHSSQEKKNSKINRYTNLVSRKGDDRITEIGIVAGEVWQYLEKYNEATLSQIANNKENETL